MTRFGRFGTQTPTPLHETDETFRFLVADWDGDGTPDLVAIKSTGTATGMTELHILDGHTTFQNSCYKLGLVFTVQMKRLPLPSLIGTRMGSSISSRSRRAEQVPTRRKCIFCLARLHSSILSCRQVLL